MAIRIRSLEDNLTYSHSLHSNERHPLLSDSLLQIKRPLERPPLDSSSYKASPDVPDEVDTASSALGSLYVALLG